VDVLLTGCSAGGIGTFMNCDWLAERLPSMSVKCRPEAGWFGLAVDRYVDFSAKPRKADSDPMHLFDSLWVHNVAPWTAEPSNKAAQQCAKALAPSECTAQAAKLKLSPTGCCNAAPKLFPYIQTPTFVAENTADSYQYSAQVILVVVLLLVVVAVVLVVVLMLVLGLMLVLLLPVLMFSLRRAAGRRPCRRPRRRWRTLATCRASSRAP